MKTNMNSKNYFSILLASALALCGNAAWAKKEGDPVVDELANIFDCDHTGTFVEPIEDADGGLIGRKVILGQDYGPLAFSNDFGAVTIDLNGWAIKGVDGAAGTTTTAGSNGGAAITVAGECGAGAGPTAITVKDDSGLQPVQLWENGPYFAKCNVGATKPEEYGYYFWWGDTVGYTNTNTGVQDNDKWLSVADGTTSIRFNSDVDPAKSTHNKDNSALETLGYIDDADDPVLNEEHDAATVHWGEPWRMMTDAELQKLTNTTYCTRTWVTSYNGKSVMGYVVKGKEGTPYENNEVFFPVAGCGLANYLKDSDSNGYYWSSVPSLDTKTSACYLYFNSSEFSRYKYSRYNGMPVRAVRESADDRPAPGSAAAIAGGKGGDGNPAGKGAFAIVDETGAEATVVDSMDLVKKGEDGAFLKSKTQEELEKIFDAENTATTVELMYDESGVFAGHKVILRTDYGPLALSNDFGAVTIDLNGWAIKGVDGANGSGTTAGGNGGAAITVAGECGAAAGQTTITVTNDTSEVPVSDAIQLWADGPYFATFNVGATKPEEPGYYFWWGDTVGYTNAMGEATEEGVWVSVEDGTTSIQFIGDVPPANTTSGKSIDELKTLDDGNSCIDVNSNLVAKFDAATAHWGAPWRMVTAAELNALNDNCTTEWTDNWKGTGKAGRIVTGKAPGYTDKSIFLPAAGNVFKGTILNDFGWAGYYWSSSPCPDSAKAWNVYFDGEEFLANNCNNRYYGRSVRPVRETAVARRPASGSAAGIVGGKGGAGTPPGEGGAAIVDGAGNPMDITDPLGFVKKGEDGLPYVAQIVTDNGATTNLFTSVQDAFDSEFTANPAVTNTVTLLRDCTEIGTKIVKISSGKVVSDVALASMVLGDLVSLNLSGIGSRTVRLDLNGKTFVGGSSEGAVFPAVIVGEGSVLIIDDSDPEKKGVIARPKAVAHRSQLDMEGAAYLGATVATFGDVTLCRGKVKGEEAFCESGASETMGIVAWGASAHLTIAGGAVENADPVGEKRNLPAGTIVFNATFSMTGGKIKDAILAVGAKVSISGGLFGADDVKNHPEWIAPDHICGENDDEATRAEGYSWAVFQPAEGSKWKPWKVGPEGSDYPQAHTNQNGELVIEGPGPVIEKPWEGGKDGITEITITDPGTELPDDVFRGMGGDDDKVKVNLPDNWKGELPDEDGNWYGAKAEIANAPFLVRNVKFLQRYPWNGLVDITADLMGYDGANVDIRVFNEKEEFKVKTLEGQTKDILFDENHRAKVHLVWDASMDVGNGFKSDAISIALFVKSAADLYYNNLMPELEHMDNDCQMKEEAAKALIGTDFESFRNDVIKFRAEMGKEIGTLQAAVVADYMASNLVANVSEKNEKVEALAGQIAMRNEMFTAQEGQIDAMRGQAEMQLQGLLMSQRNNAAPALEVKMRVIENKKGYAYETIRSDVNSYYNNYIAECQQLNEVIEKDYKDGCIIANQDKISNDIFALDTQLKKKLDEFESAIKAADQAEEVAQKEVDEKLKAVQQALDAAKKDTVENSAYSGADYSLLNEDVSRSLGNISSDLENISKQISQDKNDYAMADYRTQRLNVLEGLSNQITGQSMYFQEAAKRIAEEETATKKNLLGKVDFQRTNLGSAKAATIDKSDYSDSKYDEPRAAAASAFATCGEGIAGIVNEINTAYEEKSMKSAEQGIADKVNAIEGQILSIVDTFIAKVAEIDAAAQE